ncbi:thaumatin-like protein 1b isoform X1 [Oryza brachyantha]|uniref:thaumatin-like protein 1b isoform X1 n=1 Tax=Oryza brachyantha TaxID=4533 RepID=UPI001ADA5589|nr:thaumatin-like protein 1b isoform X1 [Oryza brachyantha]
MSRCSTHVALRLLALLFLLPAVWSATFTMTNNCGYTVWPGLLSGAGTAPLSTTGFALAHGASATVDAPASWSGRMWARTLCAEDATGKLTCATGDCGSGGIQCNGGGAAPPATLVEFTLDGSGGMDFFDVSLVDGYNLPMLVVPQGGGGAASNGSGGGGGKCMATGCLVDLNGACPADLRVMAASTGAAASGGAAVACRSACEAFGSPQYCCSGAYGNPNTCRPSTYSQFFKNACPRAYSYAYDDSTSTFTCATGTNYAITFCPSTTSGKVSGVENPQAAAAGVPSTDGTMVVLGAEQLSTTSSAVLAAPQLMMLLLPLVAAVL